jgi:hypothetical protein
MKTSARAKNREVAVVAIMGAKCGLTRSLDERRQRLSDALLRIEQMTERGEVYDLPMLAIVHMNVLAFTSNPDVPKAVALSLARRYAAVERRMKALRAARIR